MENPACWGRLAVLSPSLDPQLQLQWIHNCFLPYKTHSLPENKHCDVLNFVSPMNMCLTNMCYHISSVQNTLNIIIPVWCSSSSKTCELVTCKLVHFSKISMTKNSNSIRYIHHLHWISSICLSMYLILLISLFFREVFFTFSRVI